MVPAPQQVMKAERSHIIDQQRHVTRASVRTMVATAPGSCVSVILVHSVAIS